MLATGCLGEGVCCIHAHIVAHLEIKGVSHISRNSFIGSEMVRMVLSSYFQGMSLSGGEQLEAQERIITGLTTLHPHTSTHYHVCTDTFGAIATASSGELFVPQP